MRFLVRKKEKLRYQMFGKRLDKNVNGRKMTECWRQKHKKRLALRVWRELWNEKNNMRTVNYALKRQKKLRSEVTSKKRRVSKEIRTEISIFYIRESSKSLHKNCKINLT